MASWSTREFWPLLHNCSSWYLFLALFLKTLVCCMEYWTAHTPSSKHECVHWKTVCGTLPRLQKNAWSSEPPALLRHYSVFEQVYLDSHLSDDLPGRTVVFSKEHPQEWLAVIFYRCSLCNHLRLRFVAKRVLNFQIKVAGGNFVVRLPDRCSTVEVRQL